MTTSIREPKVGDQVASLSIVMLNVFHLNCRVFAPTREKLNEAVGQVLLQVHSFLGEIGFGAVTNETEQDFSFEITEISDPKVTRSLSIDLPEDCSIQNESRFIGSLD